MSTDLDSAIFGLTLLASAAALALWVDTRLPRLTPVDWRIVLMHLGGSLLLLYTLVPDAARIAVTSGLPGDLLLGVLGLALPSFTYLFVSSLWLLKLTQRLFDGLR